MNQVKKFVATQYKTTPGNRNNPKIFLKKISSKDMILAIEMQKINGQVLWSIRERSKNLSQTHSVRFEKNLKKISNISSRI